MSPTQRSLKKLRKEGYTVCVVEKWIAAIKQRKDAFGFGDLLAVHPHVKGALLVQTTTAANASARILKIKANKDAATWFNCGNEIHVHSWAKRGRGKRKLWSCVTLFCFDADPLRPWPRLNSDALRTN